VVDFPKRRQIWIVDFGEPIVSEPGYERRAVIVSNDTANENSPTVVVAVITEDNDRNYPWDVSVPQDASRFIKDSRVQGNMLATIDQGLLGDYKGDLSEAEMDAVEAAIRFALDL
jgi:mRNA interferase MazF